jgi:hypothetical protein
MATYRLFGLTLASDLPLNVPPGGDEPADLAFEFSTEHLGIGDATFQLVYESPRSTLAGESLATLDQCHGYERLRFPQAAEFLLSANRIAVRAPQAGTEPVLEIRLLGPVLSYWLERRGIPTLHASAVAVDGQAVAFISHHGGGKSGLAAGMMRAGYPLLTDDILPVEDRDGILLGRPGYPQMRMWPDEGAHFVERFEELPLVHPELSKRRVPVGPGGFGAFHDSALPLAAIFLAERRDPEEAGGVLEILPLSPMEAVIELVRHSFSPHLVEAAGLQPARLDLFARLVKQVPVRRLVYPSGFEHLPRVVEAILGAL